MSNTPDNPFNPTPQDKGPWLYSGAHQPQPAYTPPTIAPSPTPRPAPDLADPLAPEAAPVPPTPATPRLASPPARPAKPKPKVDDPSLAGIVDTIEAIVIALILALSFRAFVVEAFVIPTGSMAPTLLGAHFNVICPKCGYVFTKEARLENQLAYNPQARRYEIAPMGERAELTTNNTVPSDLDGPVSCPNCQYTIDPAQFPQRLTPRIAYDGVNNTTRPVQFAWTNNGDRILVLKYLYALLEPSRFDVIVFKEPMHARDNYIKRLIGLPGETVELVDGDVFIAPPGKTSSADRLIARKPPYLQKDLWQLVYDNDYYPTDAGIPRSDGTSWTNPWVAADASANSWDIRSPAFRYAASTPGMVEFNVRDPYTYNILGYDNDAREVYTSNRGRNLFRATDLRLETVWTPDESSGASISLSVGQPRNLFRATWSPTGLLLERYNLNSRSFETVETLPTAPAPVAGQGYHVALDNVDRTIRVFVNDKLLIEHETPWSAQDAIREVEERQENAPQTASRPELRINVGGACTLSHTKVFRDLFYTQDLPGVGASDPHTANTGHPLTLGPDEFFALGDNSRKSLDGRLWPTVYPALDDLATRRGIVPRRYLLGKAFCVYWPAGFRPVPTEGVPVLSTLPLVPNVGDMRLIR